MSTHADGSGQTELHNLPGIKPLSPKVTRSHHFRETRSLEFGSQFEVRGSEFVPQRGGGWSRQQRSAVATPTGGFRLPGRRRRSHPEQ